MKIPLFRSDDGKWECKEECGGSCCRWPHITQENIEELSRLTGIEAPDLDRGDGTCKHLTEDFRCGIYNNRPEICQANKVMGALGVDLDEWGPLICTNHWLAARVRRFDEEED